MGKRGKREFVQILRLLEVFRIENMLAGIRQAITRGAIGFDAVKHLVLCRIERRIKEARFPTVKSLDSFDFTAIATLKEAG
jgi:hypothetical protein